MTSNDTPNNYFPTDSSLRWNYVSPPGTAQAPIYFKKDSVREGTQVHALIYPTGSKEYYVTASDEIFLQGVYLPQVITNVGTYTADVRFRDLQTLLRDSWTAGYFQPLNGTGTVNISPTYGSRAMTFSGAVHYFGVENLSGAAGNFAAKHISVSLMMTANVDGYVFNIPYDVDFWLAENAGIVARTQGTVSYYLVSLTGGVDSDHDGVMDSLDAFPNDPTETKDSDHDGIGDNSDLDLDNDGVANADDAFPNDPNEWADFDHDGIGDNADPDKDTDHDGIADNIDTDDDNDGVADTLDKFPLDPTEWADLDNDGIGDNADTDKDNDGYADTIDYFPNDPDHWEQSVIYASDDGIALSSLPGGGRLSQTITVLDSNDLTSTPWSATADQPWLTVTSNGVTGGPLTITADPSTLADDSIHYATVSISPSNSTAQAITATVRVALWKGTSSPAANSPITLPWNTYALVTPDPLRPYVYVYNGDAGPFGVNDGKIYVYNIYTQSLVGTINLPMNDLGQVTISGDGKYLFVTDTTSYTFYSKVVRVDLDNLATTPTVFNLNELGIRMTYSRPRGHGVIIMENGRIYDADTMQPFNATFIGPIVDGATVVTASTDGTRFCGAEIGGNYPPYHAGCFSLRYTSLDTPSVKIVALGSGTLGIQDQITNVALSPDGSSFYLGHGGVITAYHTLTTTPLLTLPAPDTGSGVYVGSEGAIYGASLNSAIIDVWSHNSDLTLRARKTISPLTVSFAISADEQAITYVTHPQSGNDQLYVTTND